MKEIRIPAKELQDFCEAVFQKSLPEEETKVIAASLVEADLYGVTSHGVQRVAGYLKRMEEGLIERSTNVQIVSDLFATALLDANNGWGQVAGMKAMELAMEKADQFGVAFVGVRNSNHFGISSFYTRMAAEKGFIGISMTNASPNMVPFGAKEPSLGTNPLSIAIPGGEGKTPIVLDMSTSNVARGKIMVAKKNGEPIPDNWAITKEGKKTTDPDEAWDGYVLPMGPKGSGLAIMIDILSGVLTGSLFGKSIPRQYDDPYPQRLGHLFGVINISNFIDQDMFYHNMEEKVKETVSSQPSEGFKSVLMPGDLENLTKNSRIENGIPLSLEIFHELVETGLKYDVDINEYVSTRLAD